jgi:iron-sulfur cluster repair protein YtfE (RIC family)
VNDVSQYLQTEHRYCDELFDLIEPLAVAAKWQEAREALLAFQTALTQHLDREERVLFPAMEAAHGGPMGPTRMMRMEHDGMRDLLVQMEEAVGRADAEQLSAVVETLRILLQQHNMKEESVLYPMADRLLADRIGDLLQAMEARRTPARAT